MSDLFNHYLYNSSKAVEKFRHF